MPPGLTVRRGAEFVCAFGGPTIVRPHGPDLRKEACGPTRTAWNPRAAWVGEGLPE